MRRKTSRSRGPKPQCRVQLTAPEYKDLNAVASGARPSWELAPRTELSPTMLKGLVNLREAPARVRNELAKRGPLRSPHSGGAIRRRGDQCLAIGAERHRIDVGLVAA